MLYFHSSENWVFDAIASNFARQKLYTSTSVLRQLGPYLGLGAQLAASVLVPGAVGYWVDGQFASEPIGLIAGLVIGSSLGFVQFLRSVQQLQKRSSELAKNDSDDSEAS